MRILHVINSLSGSGGAEQGLVREVTHFPPEVEQLVVTLYDGGSLLERLDEAGVSHVSLGLDSSGSGWNWPLAVARLRGVISEFAPDVVQSSLFSGNLVAQMATSSSSIPTLSTFTLSGDLALHRALQPGASSWYASWLRRVGARASRRPHVWFRALTSHALETNCAATGVDEIRGVVIPRGVPIADLRRSQASRSDLGLPTDAPVILNVGRQTAQKGHAHLLEALPELAARYRAHLVILGREGDASPVIERSLDLLGIRDHVTIIPYTNRVADYYANADVFVFPALMEGLGTAVIEAMAAGVPVIAFDIPPVREVVGDGRFARLVPSGDSSELFAAIDAVLAGDSDPTDMVAEARRWTEEQFDVQQIADRVFARLSTLVSAGRPSR